MSQPRKSFTTKTGLELPLLSLKGKEYLQVMHRVYWFRTEKPTGTINTSLVEKGGQGKDAYAIFRAEVSVDGTIIASGTKMETAGGFPDYIEKAESGAIGRALALCGYGTQFCSDEFDEGDRLADSPAPVLEKTTESVAAATTTTATGRRPSFRKTATSMPVAANTDDI